MALSRRSHRPLAAGVVVLNDDRCADLGRVDIESSECADCDVVVEIERSEEQVFGAGLFDAVVLRSAPLQGTMRSSS